MKYCRDCKYFVRGTIDDYTSYFDYCAAPTGIIIDDPVYGPREQIIDATIGKDKDYPNKNGDCKFYVKKWWHFWVKDKNVN